ncbi:MAG: dethiobiotin synthase [Verrucomicrobia bacterium]|nr:dethiobiotin synthase [Verrucomicrobiota bacterium]
MSRIIFITGTGTGVGKTTLTCLLLRHLRDSGVKALAMKPFCSGGKDDLKAFQTIQGEGLSQRLLNPYYFPEPLAPALAKRDGKPQISLSSTLRVIRAASQKCDCLLVEGAGGVLVPITKHLMMADVIAALDCDVIVVSKNELGTLNHTLLTLEALRSRRIWRMKVVFFETKNPDASSKSNPVWIAECPINIGVFKLPYRKSKSRLEEANLRESKNFQKTLAQICGPDSFCPVVRTAEKSSETKD